MSEIEELKELLLEIPPKLESAQRLLQEKNLSSEALTNIAAEYLDACKWEDGRSHAVYAYQAMEMLLRYGLEPNSCYEGKSLLHRLLFMEHDYMSADTLGLLFAHGADPNLKDKEETVFEGLDFDIWFGSVEMEDRKKYDSWLHSWMVFLSWGAEFPRGVTPTLFREFGSSEPFDLKKLRQHRNFYWGLSIEDGQRTVHIYDKNTMWEVVRV